MPTYQFIHPDSRETVEIVQGMKENHFYIDEKGVEWERVWTKPTMSSDTSNMDPFSSKDFVKKTRNKNYSIGQMWELSRELSDKRQGTEGKDPVKSKHENDRSKSINKKRQQNAATVANEVKKLKKKKK